TSMRRSFAMICSGVKLLRGILGCSLPGLNSLFQPGLETTGHVTIEPRYNNQVRLDSLWSSNWDEVRGKGLGNFLANLAVQVLQRTQHPNARVVGLASDPQNDAPENRRQRLKLWEDRGLKVADGQREPYLEGRSGQAQIIGTISGMHTRAPEHLVYGLFDPTPALADFTSLPESDTRPALDPARELEAPTP
uniref:hypothetical protein n=1 Tax=Ralstonia sp. ASV6 TaxID=2795124 RepID=UPI0018EC39FA